ncbi:hypothetical protein [Acidimangrovimonas pyrenivorans]|uniref:Uncharacterized protein n=1 Tax=Acidimangrovimonas pyrenivorans TaxID=2030798 RepID=A0ABV7AFF8_9RHOB
MSRTFYALRQAQAGSLTTINGRPVERLAGFDSKAERAAWCDEDPRRRHVLTRREAEKEAREIYGVSLSKLDRRDTFSHMSDSWPEIFDHFDA